MLGGEDVLTYKSVAPLEGRFRMPTIYNTHTHMCVQQTSCMENPPSSLKEILSLSFGQLDVQFSRAQQLSIKR